MKKQKKSSYRYLIILVAAAILLLGGLVFYLLFNNAREATKQSSEHSINIIDYSPPTSEQSAPASDTDKNDGTPDENSSNLSVSITSANQDNGMLRVRSLIQPAVSSGECHITLENTSSQKIENTSDIQNLASSSTCKGFDIPIGSLSAGKWTITLKVSANKSAGTATKEITIQ